MKVPTLWRRSLRRNRRRRAFARTASAFMATAGIVLLTLFAVTAPVQAATTNESQTQVTVDPGEQVHDLFVIGKDVDIKGHVTDNLIAIDSNVHIASGGQVDTLLAMGGHIVKSPGAHVGNALIFTPDGIVNHLSIGIAFVSLAILFKFVACVILVFSSVAFSGLLKPWYDRSIHRLEKSVRKQFIFGLLMSVAVFAAMAGFAATGVGIPIAVLLGIADIVIGLIGISVISIFIGRTILQAYRPNSSTWIAALIGAILVVAGANIPIVGIVLFSIAWCIGTSSVLTSLRRTRSGT